MSERQKQRHKPSEGSKDKSGVPAGSLEGAPAGGGGEGGSYRDARGETELPTEKFGWWFYKSVPNLRGHVIFLVLLYVKVLCHTPEPASQHLCVGAWGDFCGLK